MRKTMHTNLIYSVALATVIFSGPALADLYRPNVTSHCQASSRLERSYETGYWAGRSLANSAWIGEGGGYDSSTGMYDIGTFNPDELDFFQWEIIDAFLTILRPGATEFVECRYEGMVEGAFDMLALVNSVVIGVCVIDGAFVGEFSAHMYCDLATAFNGLGIPEWLARMPLGICGNYFEWVCDDVYDFVSTDGNNAMNIFTSSYLASQGFFPVHYLNLTGMACEPYTAGSYFPTWVTTRNNVCKY